MTYLTKPANPPAAVTIEEARSHCRVDGNGDDVELARLIVSATADAQGETGRALVSQPMVLGLDGFADRIELPMPPIVAVDAVKFLDSNGDTQTVPSAVYRLVPHETRPAIVLRPGQAWPSGLMAGVGDGVVTVEYTAGYGQAEADVPQPIRQWILLRVGDGFANREGTNVGNIVTPFKFVDHCLDQYRVYP